MSAGRAGGACTFTLTSHRFNLAEGEEREGERGRERVRESSRTVSRTVGASAASDLETKPNQHRCPENPQHRNAAPGACSGEEQEEERTEAEARAERPGTVQQKPGPLPRKSRCESRRGTRRSTSASADGVEPAGVRSSPQSLGRSALTCPPRPAGPVM